MMYCKGYKQVEKWSHHLLLCVHLRSDVHDYLFWVVFFLHWLVTITSLRKKIKIFLLFIAWAFRHLILGHLEDTKISLLGDLYDLKICICICYFCGLVTNITPGGKFTSLQEVVVTFLRQEANISEPFKNPVWKRIN